jgi:hypothetical protein
MGKPISVKKVAKEDITPQLVDELHEVFIKEMLRLFERTKKKHGVKKSIKLEIL